MSVSHNKAHIPSNPTLKEINWFKKQINWGELPPFYHLIASSVSESEGILNHGFDNAVKHLIDKRNWNLDILDGYEDKMQQIKFVLLLSQPTQDMEIFLQKHHFYYQLDQQQGLLFVEPLRV